LQVPGGDEVFAVYLRAKAQADAALQASDREWTILRPGGLTDDTGTGRVRIDNAPFSGPVSRDDVASVLARLLTDPRSVGRVLYLSSGAQSIEQALDEVLGSPRLLSKETHRDEASNYGSGHGRYERSHRPGSGGANAARCYCSWIASRKRFGGCPRRSAGASGSHEDDIEQSDIVFVVVPAKAIPEIVPTLNDYVDGARKLLRDTWVAFQEALAEA
jgi:hypothetical protein